MDASATALTLKIDSAAARADLDALSKAIDKASAAGTKLDRSLASMATGVEQSLGRATRAMAKYAEVATLLSKIKISGSASTQLRELGSAIDAVGKARGVADNKIASVRSLAAALNGLQSPSHLAATLRTLETLSAFKGPTPSSIKRLEQMFAVLQSAKAIPNAGKIAADLDTVAASASRAARALGTLPSGLRSFNTAISSTGNATTAQARALSGIPAASNRARSSVVQLSQGLDGLNARFRTGYQLGTVFGTMFAAFTLGTFVRSVYEADVALLKLQKAVLFSTGTFDGATKATDQYLAISQKLGLSVTDTVETYGRFVIAAKASGLTLTQTNKIYEALGTAMAVVGSSAQQQQLAFYGLTEMMQKGVVYSKEFNRQIGAQLPGNAVIGARALSELTGKKVTVAQFFQAMHSGMIQSAQFIPVWANEVQKMYQVLLPLAQARPDIAITRLQNSFVMFAREIGQGSFITAIGQAINGITAQIVTTGKDGIPHLTQGMKDLADTLGHGLADVINGVGTGLQFIVGHLHEIIEGLKAFAAFEVVSQFASWSHAAMSAAASIAKLAEANTANMRSAIAAATAQRTVNAATAATAGGGFSASAYRAAIANNAAASGIRGFVSRAAPVLDAGVSTAFAAIGPVAMIATVALAAFSDKMSGLTSATQHAITYGDIVSGFFDTLGHSINGFLSGVTGSLKLFGPEALKAGNLVAGIGAFILSTLSAFFLPFREIGIAVGTGISNLITSLVGLGRVIYDVVHGQITAAYNDAKATGSALFRQTVGGYGAMGNTAYEALLGAGSFNSTYAAILNGASQSADARNAQAQTETAGQKQIEAAVQLQNASAALETASTALTSAAPTAQAIPTAQSVLAMIDDLAAGRYRYGTPNVTASGAITPATLTPQLSAIKAINEGAGSIHLGGLQNSNLDPEVLRAIAFFESSLNPSAINRKTGAQGLFQIQDSTYAGLVRNNPSLAGADRKNPADAVRLYGELLREDVPVIAQALGRSLSNSEIYMTGMLGRPAATKFLTEWNGNPNATTESAASVVGANVANANRGVFYDGKTPRSMAQVMEYIAQHAVNGTSTGMAQLSEGSKPLTPAEIGQKQDEIRKGLNDIEGAANPATAALAKYEDALLKIQDLLRKEAAIESSGHGAAMLTADDRMKIADALKVERLALDDALDPLTKLHRLTEESNAVDALRAKGLDDLADWQTELNKLTEEHLTLSDKMLAADKAQFLMDEERKKQLEAITELQKAVVEASVAKLRLTNTPAQNQVLDQVLKLPGTSYQDKLAYAQQSGALPVYQATAQANAGANTIGAVNKITNDLSDQASDTYADKTTQKYREYYRDYLRELTGDTTDSIAQIESKFGAAYTDMAAAAAKMKADLENPPGFQKWVDGVKPLSDALEDLKAKFAEGLSDALTDAALGKSKQGEWKKALEGLTHDATKAQVDNLLAGFFKGTGLAQDHKLSPDQQALLTAGNTLNAAAEMQIRAAQALITGAPALRGSTAASELPGPVTTNPIDAVTSAASASVANAATSAATSAAANIATTAATSAGINAAQQLTSGQAPGVAPVQQPTFWQKLLGVPGPTGTVGAMAHGGASGFVDNMSQGLMNAASVSPGAGILNFASNLFGLGNVIPGKGQAPQSSVLGSLLTGDFSGIGASPATVASGAVSATGQTNNDILSSLFGAQSNSPLSFVGKLFNGDIGGAAMGALGDFGWLLNGLFKDPTKPTYNEPNGIIGTMSQNRLTYQTKAATPNLWAALLNMAFQGGMGSENQGTKGGLLQMLTPGSSAFGGQGSSGLFGGLFGNLFGDNSGAVAAASGASDAAGSGLFSSIGDFFAGLFSEGGISTQPIEVVKLRGGHRDFNIRHYAEGTHNTSGGMPAILHPNEAVIPLSRGRKVPVELSGGAHGGGAVFNSVVNITAPNPDTFRAASGSIASSQNQSLKRAAYRNLFAVN